MSIRFVPVIAVGVLVVAGLCSASGISLPQTAVLEAVFTGVTGAVLHYVTLAARRRRRRPQ